MNINISSILALAVTGLFVSCGTTDTTPPTVCEASGLTGLPSVLFDEIEVEAGSTVSVHDAFCDDEGLGEIRWDLHSAEGHEHTGGEEEEEFTLNSGTDWEVLEIRSVEGTEAEESFTFDVPLTARGIWDLVVSVVDAEGNAAADIITTVHVENGHLPEFSLSTVDGVDPSTWEEEPVWAPGSTISISGAVGDTDGVAEVAILFIRESDEAVVWSTEVPASGAMTIPFSVEVNVPLDAPTGEYHLELEAEDATGVEVHTGFHVEVE